MLRWRRDHHDDVHRPECSAPLAELSEDALGELRLREPDALRKLVRSLYRTHALTQGAIGARLGRHKSWVCRRRSAGV